MNLNAPRQDIRECKHSSPAMSLMEMMTQGQQPYSFSVRHAKPIERQHTQDTVRSRSIPIGKASMQRTASELKLADDEAVADFQDYVFFSRLLSGIAKKQQEESVSDKFLQESDECLAHIIGTRNESLDNLRDATATASLLPTTTRGFSDERSSQKVEDDGIFVMDM